MKAYMSDTHEHDIAGPCARLEAVDGYLRDYQHMAVGEARRILAETEPARRGWERQLALGAPTFNERAHQALADSLRAFIAAPNPDTTRAAVR